MINPTTKLIHSIPPDVKTKALPGSVELELAMAGLENGGASLAFGSFYKAFHSLMALLSPGDEVLICMHYLSDDPYLSRISETCGITLRPSGSASPAEISKMLSPKTRLIFMQSVTPPRMSLTDIPALSGIAADAGCLLCIDNTLATPAFQRPLDLGADIVLHSELRLLCGYGSGDGAVLVTREEKTAEGLRLLREKQAGVLTDATAGAVIRGLETLFLRMRKHSDNATRIVKLLLAYPSVTKVFYPGLCLHPGHKVSSVHASGFGGYIVFCLNREPKAVERFLLGTRIFRPAESFGGSRSLCRLLSKNESMIGLWAGLEEGIDQLRDLEKALYKASKITVSL